MNLFWVVTIGGLFFYLMQRGGVVVKDSIVKTIAKKRSNTHKPFIRINCSTCDLYKEPFCKQFKKTSAWKNNE